MQWILQKFEDTEKLALALERLGIPYTWHKVIPFVGKLIPDPDVPDPDSVILFGSYSLWKMAEARGWRPGVFRIAPFITQDAWSPYLLNGDERLRFIRPVDDSKELAGTVMTQAEIVQMARNVLSLDEDEIPNGSLRHDTELLLAAPVSIRKEWRCWVVDEEVVTWSLYKLGARVTYRHEIDEDALAFARHMTLLNPGYAKAYVLDVCLTDDGLRIIETNCINAAGFYAADLQKLASALHSLKS